MTKQCIKCNQELPVKMFYKHSIVNGTQYYMSLCKPCNTQKSREWKLENFNQWKSYMKKYTPEYYLKLKEEQPNYYKEVYRKNNPKKEKEQPKSKVCKRCSNELPVEMFPKARMVKEKQYYKSYCKPCHRK